MSYPPDLSLVLAAAVQSMTHPMVIMDMQVNGDLSISLEVCDLRHAEPGRYVTIGANQYKIRSIDDVPNTIVLEPGPAIAVTTFDLYPVHFFEGAPYDVAKQIENISNAVDKTPMIFLLLPYNNHIYDDVEDTRAMDSKASIFVLTQANFDKWSTGNLMDNAVRPMSRLQHNFKEHLKADTATLQFINKEFDVVPRPKFGVYVSNKGVQKGFAAMDLSGVQWDTTLTILKSCSPDVCG